MWFKITVLSRPSSRYLILTPPVFLDLWRLNQKLTTVNSTKAAKTKAVQRPIHTSIAWNVNGFLSVTTAWGMGTKWGRGDPGPLVWWAMGVPGLAEWGLALCPSPAPLEGMWGEMGSAQLRRQQNGLARPLTSTRKQPKLREIRVSEGKNAASHQRSSFFFLSFFHPAHASKFSHQLRWKSIMWSVRGSCVPQKVRRDSVKTCVWPLRQRHTARNMQKYCFFLFLHCQTSPLRSRTLLCILRLKIAVTLDKNCWWQKAPKFSMPPFHELFIAVAPQVFSNIIFPCFSSLLFLLGKKSSAQQYRYLVYLGANAREICLLHSHLSNRGLLREVLLQRPTAEHTV